MVTDAQESEKEGGVVLCDAVGESGQACACIVRDVKESTMRKRQ